MTITTQVYVILAGHRSTVEVSSDYCLAETVIVGLSPNAYTVVQEAKRPSMRRSSTITEQAGK